MRRTLFTAEHEEFRQHCRGFFEKEIAPHAEEWEQTGMATRDAWRKAGDAGVLLWQAPEEHGGQGIVDFRYNYVVAEEFVASGSVGLGLSLLNDIMAPYLTELANEEQQRRWLPAAVAGESVWAIGMTEPGAGSDVKAIRTTAVRDGDDYVVNGSKTFITNGVLATHVLVVAKTEPSAGHRGVSLLVVEDGMPGFSRGRKLEKVGQLAQDTGELFFDDVRVPARNLVGEENRGFYHLMANLPQERLGVATLAVASMRRAVEVTIDYVREREVFGQPLGALQNTRFELADCATQVQAATAFVDAAVAAHCAGELTAEDAAGLKQWTSDVQWNVTDRCVQLFGGYGYMREYEINRLWRDARVQRVYAGSNEVMKEIVGRSLGLETSTRNR
ncbi:MAG TPA: acyl-CoA dehydrogenase family protein [Mycobacteriales bacterium]|nr:acyl-CoA dehydrogenase family protein [Mycobacteriales bacterium]